VLLCTATPLMVAALTCKVPRALKVFCAVAIPLAMVAEIMTISRAGVTIMGMVLFGAAMTTPRLRVTPKTVGIALVVVLGVTGLIAKSWNTLGQRFRSSTLKDEYGSVKRNMGRGYYLRMAKVIAQDRFFGVGLNNWSYWVSDKYGPEQGYRFVPYRGQNHEPSDVVPPTSNVDEAQAAPAHNLGALTLGELGIPGLFLFTILWMRWFQMGGSFLRWRDPDPMRRMALGIFFGLCGMFLHCLTEWVFRHVPLYYVIHIFIGALMSLYYIKRHAPEESLAVEQPEAEWSGPLEASQPAMAQAGTYPDANLEAEGT
jgi:hypothetical protein